MSHQSSFVLHSNQKRFIYSIPSTYQDSPHIRVLRYWFFPSWKTFPLYAKLALIFVPKLKYCYLKEVFKVNYLMFPQHPCWLFSSSIFHVNISGNDFSLCLIWFLPLTSSLDLKPWKPRGPGFLVCYCSSVTCIISDTYLLSELARSSGVHSLPLPIVSKAKRLLTLS